MAYTIPDFPLSCEIFTATSPPDLTTLVTRGVEVCQLRLFGPHPRNTSAGFGSSGLLVGEAAVLFPAATDVRDQSQGPAGDILEIPVASGRYYYVSYVDDVAKGFPNEYRQAFVIKAFTSPAGNFLNFPLWPIPMP